MRVKKGVSLTGIHEKMRHAMDAADKIYKAVTGTDCELTSGTESIRKTGLASDVLIHSPKSLHPCGRAIDVGIKCVAPDDIKMIVRQLCHTLGMEYDIVQETTHIHIEYDPKVQ